MTCGFEWHVPASSWLRARVLACVSARVLVRVRVCGGGLTSCSEGPAPRPGPRGACAPMRDVLRERLRLCIPDVLQHDTRRNKMCNITHGPFTKLFHLATQACNDSLSRSRSSRSSQSHHLAQVTCGGLGERSNKHHRFAQWATRAEQGERPRGPPRMAAGGRQTQREPEQKQRTRNGRSAQNKRRQQSIV